MSDSDSDTIAWQLSPSRYLKDRAPEYGQPAGPASLYVPMRDGCRLAIDVYLPQGERKPAQGWPAILILTPYYRRFALRDGASASTDPSPNAAKYRDFFVPRGYALVVVDVRGTGASFGSRDSFRSPVEREDFREIADWVVSQPWSDGVIGSTGISYLGAAACFLASTGHPAVRAIAPLFAVWNTYVDHLYPGGVLLNELAESYDKVMAGLDQDRRDLLAEKPYFNNADFAGPQPVDDDSNGALCRAAVREHSANFRMRDFITEFRFSDDCLAYKPSFGVHSISPYHYADEIDPGCAIYSISGWMDGAGFANGAIARLLSLPNNKQHLLLGPWDHGARTNVSPWRNAAQPEFNVLAEVLRFFDHYLLNKETGLQNEAPIHYFCMHEEQWRSATSWPPLSENWVLHLSADNAMSHQVGASGEDVYAVDFATGTGKRTRHERLAALDTTEYYPDWQCRERAMLSYTSPPLGKTTEISGHPIVDLWIASSQPDAILHVYLSAVEPDGTAHYVTEGVLRALHRRETVPPSNQKWSWPFRDFSRANAEPLVPGEPVRLRFALLPISWSFQIGNRIRLSIAGADCDHYVQLPHGRPPILNVKRGGELASSLILPRSAGTEVTSAKRGIQ